MGRAKTGKETENANKRTKRQGCLSERCLPSYSVVRDVVNSLQSFYLI